DLLARAAPRLRGRPSGGPIVPESADHVPAAVAAIAALDGSYMPVQGPPGSGKSHTSGEAIVALLKAGKRIGVASNSHKAINALLTEVEEAASRAGVRFRGVKKSSTEEQMLAGGGWIVDTLDNGVACDPAYQLVAGTAWLFARPEMDRALDYLFIDEAGQ